MEQVKISLCNDKHQDLKKQTNQKPSSSKKLLIPLWGGIMKSSWNVASFSTHLFPIQIVCCEACQHIKCTICNFSTRGLLIKTVTNGVWWHHEVAWNHGSWHLAIRHVLFCVLTEGVAWAARSAQFYKSSAQTVRASFATFSWISPFIARYSEIIITLA